MAQQIIYPLGLEPHFSRYMRFLDTRPLRDLQKEKGFEIHHRIPKSLGGSNSTDNLIKLTTREHFIAHLILWKCYGGMLAYAFHYMTISKKYEEKLTARQYEMLVSNRGEQMSRINKGRVRSEEFKKNQRARRFHLSDEAKKKVSLAKKGKKMSKDAIARMAETKRNNPLTEKQLAQLQRLHANSKEVHAKATATRKRNRQNRS